MSPRSKLHRQSPERWFYSSRSASCGAQAGPVFRCADFNSSKRARALSVMFSGLVSHRYLLLVRVASLLFSSLLYSWCPILSRHAFMQAGHMSRSITSVLTRAGKVLPRRVADIYLYLLPRHIQFDSLRRPGRRQPKQLPVQLRAFHRMPSLKAMPGSVLSTH